MLIETFGSPFSPLNETELQIALLHALALPNALICSSTVGGSTRSLNPAMRMRSCSSLRVFSAQTSRQSGFGTMVARLECMSVLAPLADSST